MMRYALMLFFVSVWLPAYSAGMNDDPMLMMFKIDQLEKTDVTADNNTAWEASMWLGRDLNKLWLKTEGDVVDGETEEAELQLLYSRAIAPYWDMQFGLRHDVKPKPNREWLAMSLYGLAPYFFETDISLFVGEKGNIAVRAQFEYELMLTQKWVLSPDLEANVYSKTDQQLETGSGLADINFGLRLRYEISRQFAPYIGWQWRKHYGQTADFIRAEGEKISDSEWVAGVRVWW